MITFLMSNDDSFMVLVSEYIILVLTYYVIFKAGTFDEISRPPVEIIY